MGLCSICIALFQSQLSGRRSICLTESESAQEDVRPSGLTSQRALAPPSREGFGPQYTVRTPLLTAQS